MRYIFFALLFFLVPTTIGIAEESTNIYQEGSTVYIVGKIYEDAYSSFSLIDLKKVKSVYLDSGGGKLYTAIDIAEKIRENNIETYVAENAECASACTVIFQAGSTRTAYIDSAFMYHCAYRKGDQTDIDWIATNTVFELLLEYGISQKLIDQIKPGKDLEISGLETLNYNIVNNLIIK